MNRINKPSAARLVAIALVLALAPALAGCGAGAPKEEPPLAGASIGGDFTLANSKGEPVRWGDFAGKYRVVYFGYAFCPDICPTDMQRVAQGLKALKASDPEKAAKIQPIFITIDPERDTPALLKGYVPNFGPTFIGLTGTPEQVAAVARAYRVYYQKVPGKDGGPYLMDHSSIIYLLDRNGRFVTHFTHDAKAEAIAAAVGRLL